MSYYTITVVFIKQDSPIIYLFRFQHNLFKKQLFSIFINRMEEIRFIVRNWERLDIFEKRFLQFIRPSSDSIYHCMSHVGLK